ncbi:MAG: K(+)-transporting ATPase subunit F [Brockia lithotrophica]|nr:K(+)-transporting ATPase subunit F [Brockia lithotrophica]
MDPPRRRRERGVTFLLALTVLLFVYLAYALLFAERF